MTNITLRVLGAALLSAGLFSVTAQAANIGQVDASITGLRYRLVDLDLEDGITPTLSVSGELSAVGYAGGYDPYYGDVYFDQGSAEPIYAPVFGESGLLVLNNSVSGTTATLGSVISTSSSLGSEAWGAAAVNQNTDSYSYGGYVYDDAGVLRNSLTTVTSTNTTQGQGFRAEAGGESVLTINGKALLLIEGTAALTSQFDRSTLMDAYNSVPLNDSSSGYGAGQTSGTINLELMGPQYDSVVLPGNTLWSSFGGSVFSFSSMVTFSESGASLNQNGYGSGTYIEDITGGTGDTQNFGLAYAHVGNDPADVSFRILVDSTVSQYFRGYTSETVTVLGAPVEVVTPPVVVPSIPEPGTYALMGLGLIGMAAAVRRARRTAPGV